MQEADRAALAMALGMATDWVCRYARALDSNRDDKVTDYRVIANFAACHGEEQLCRFDELVKSAAVHAPDMQAEARQIITILRQLLAEESVRCTRCPLALPLKRQPDWGIIRCRHLRYARTIRKTSYDGVVHSAVSIRVVRWV